jgi:RNA polymerase sigma-70 factor, ECF subfamily
MTTAEQSFAAVYTQYLPAISAYLARRVERASVEDLAADVFAVAWQKRDQVASGEELPWLYRIAGNLVANHRRRVASGASFIAHFRPLDSSPSAEDIVVADAALAAAWKQLRSRDREIISLALLEDLPIPTIAIALDISENAASIRLHRARKSLTELMTAKETLSTAERTEPRTT